jgi:hypothetical protein
VSTAFARAREAIDRRGVLLVYPLANRPEPRSLWSELYPRSTMRWTWDDAADPRVARLWHLREELARSPGVVYAKWFRGRATLFAPPVFRAILASLDVATGGDSRLGLSRQARALLDFLEDDSPLSTKELRARAELSGRANEAAYTRAMRELWSRLLVVGVGEVEDGAFPSLAMSATRLRFEELWPTGTVDAEDAGRLREALEEGPLFARELEKMRASLVPLGASKGAPIALLERPDTLE